MFGIEEEDEEIMDEWTLVCENGDELGGAISIEVVSQLAKTVDCNGRTQGEMGNNVGA